MTRLTLAAAALASVLAAGTFSVATAKTASAHHWHGGGVSIHLGHGYGRAHFAFGCRRFYRRYLKTGSLYWLDRYQACRYGY